MKTSNKNPIVISNPCALACVLAVRNILSKYHVPVRFLVAILIEKIRKASLEMTTMFFGVFFPLYRDASLLTTTKGKPINPTGFFQPCGLKLDIQLVHVCIADVTTNLLQTSNNCLKQ